MPRMKNVARFLLPLLLFCFAAVPALAQKPKEKMDFAEWLGEYCNETNCLKIYNVRQGGIGMFLMYGFTTVEGKELGEENAPLDDKNPRFATYSILDFNLSKDGKTIEVTRDPAMKALPEDSGWIEKVFGTYTKTE